LHALFPSVLDTVGGHEGHSAWEKLAAAISQDDPDNLAGNVSCKDG